MPKQEKVLKLLTQPVPLALSIENDRGSDPLKLDLKLAWTMRGVILVETKCRELGIPVNVLQNPSAFWTGMDATTLAIAVWAMSNQEHPEYRDDDGFDILASYINAENQDIVSGALREAYLQSFSKKRREQIEEAVREADREQKKGSQPDPTAAQGQSSPQ